MMSNYLAYFMGGVATVAASIWMLLRIFPWLKYDILYIRALVRLLLTYKLYKRRNKMLIDIFEGHAKSNPHKTFVIFEDVWYSYEQMNKQANRVANAALSIGVKKADVVAMLQYNGPAFIWTYFGEYVK